MTIENDLLQSSVSWRGHPHTYTQGALGDTGSKFRTAFERVTMQPDVQSQYTFEYFTGLLFNGNYADLESLTALIDSWLDTGPPVPDAGLHILKSFEIGSMLLASGGDISVNLPPGWYVHKPYGDSDFFHTNVRYQLPVFPRVLGDNYPLWMDTIQLRIAMWWMFRDGHTVTGLYSEVSFNPMIRDHIIGMNYRNNLTSLEVGEPITIGTDGKATILDLLDRSHNPLDTGVIEIWWPTEVALIQTGEGFTQQIVDALQGYVAGEVADNRQPPSIVSTASANNGYVFKNWAEGKYGSTVAQEVG